MSQPILSDLRAGAGYFVARRVQPLDIVVLVAGGDAGPGVAANVVVWLAGRLLEGSPLACRGGLVGIFLTLLLRTFALRIVSAPVAALLIPIAIGTAMAVTYYRSDWLRDGLRLG